MNGKTPAFAWSKGTSVPTKGDGWTIHVMDEKEIGDELEQPTCWRQPHDKHTIECYFRDCAGKSIYAAESKDGKLCNDLLDYFLSPDVNEP